MLGWIEDYYTYRPERGTPVIPADVTESTVSDELGNEIHLIHRKGSTPYTIVFCHGNGGNLGSFPDRFELFEQLDASYLSFDYPGYGKSSGRPSEEALYQSGRAVIRHLESALGVSPNQIVLYGLSLGAAVALELACTEEVAGLILESPFTCTHAMGAMIVPILPLFKFLPKRSK